MVAEEELRARAVLAEMLMRISQGPYSALSVSESASAEQVRHAFLEHTKQFHPARFGRMSSDLLRMANEVFLGIKAAHEQLIKQLGSSGRSLRPSGAVPTVIPAQQGGTVRGTGLVSRTQTQPGQSSQSIPRATDRGTDRGLDRGTDRATTRPSTPLMTPPPPRAQTPLTTPSSGTPRAASPVQSTQPLPRAQTPAAGIPIQRSSTPPPEPDRRPTPASGIPAQSRPASPQSPNQPRASSSQANRTPAPEIINPPTIRYSGAAQSGARSGALDEDAELKQAMNLLSSKDWGAARSAFHALAAKVPQSRRYRALLCYARGRETQATGRNDDAVLEFQRALQLDPDLELAKDAIREVTRKSRW